MRTTTITISGICLATLFATGALAQPAPPPGGPPGPEIGAAPSTPPGGAAVNRDGPPPPPARGPEGRRPPPPPPSKAAHFRVDVGAGAGIDVKCADDEPMRPCADIAFQLLDRVMGPGGAASPPPPGVPAPPLRGPNTPPR
jgi:hypothetical protein